ncbi:hypothetical protein RvY_10418 [Ramazzottius varieornatus]|uniref:RING-type E3 ubiquitin transferase n=1 Tax=Ramazzottius varieornatus TaxID=947166 RepID=A0A1D1VLQ0_RAMVA|nr:hypothetical protein RvY_10418 [Ramazzottius varieornatus]
MDASYDFSFPERLLQQMDTSGMGSHLPQPSAGSSNASLMQMSTPRSTSQDDRSHQPINGQVHYFGPYSPPAVTFSVSSPSVGRALSSTNWEALLNSRDMDRIDGIPNPETDDMELDMETEPPSTELAFANPLPRRTGPEVPFRLPSNDHNYARRESSAEHSSPEIASNVRSFTFRPLSRSTANIDLTESSSSSSLSSSLEGQANNSTISSITSSGENRNEGGFRSRFSARLRNASLSLLGAVTGRRSASPEIPLPSRSMARRAAASREADRPRRVLRPPSRHTPRFTDMSPSLDSLFSNFLPRSATVSKVGETGLNASSKKKILPKLKETMQKLGIDSDQPRSSRAMTPDKCSICLEVPTKLTASLTFPCLHTFCEECISHWVKTKNSCPNCQANVTRIVFNLRSEHDYDVKPVEERNELMNPALPVDGDVFEIFWQLHRHRLERQRQDRAPERTVAEPAARASVTRQVTVGRGNPYTNRHPIREAFEVGRLYDRAFPDQPNAEIQALVLVNGFEVSRVEFRRRVYGENLQGGVKILSVEQVRLAPSQLEASTTNYQGYWDRLQPWLRREITAAMVPEVSNAQREHAFAVIGHVMRSPSGVQMVAFTSAVDNFMSATRALKFWDEMSQFLLSRTQMGVWDKDMKYFDVNGSLVTVPSTPVLVGPVRGRDYVVYSVPETDYSDSDDSIQYVGTVVHSQQSPARTRSVTTTSSIVANFDEDDSMNSLGDEYIPTRPTSSMYTSDADSERISYRRRLRSPSLASSDPFDDDFVVALRTSNRADRSPTPPRRFTRSPGLPRRMVSRAVREESSRSSRYSMLRRLAREGRHRRRSPTSSEESRPSSHLSSRIRRGRESSERRSTSSRTPTSFSHRTERRPGRLERRARTVRSRREETSLRR